jgi:phosphate transport system protein
MRRTRQSFDEQLQRLEKRLLLMGERTEEMLARAVQALAQHDVPLAHQVIEADDRVDALDLGIEQDCMRLLALQQPMSRDLRTIGTVMKVISDVERIGDYSVDIARTAIKLADTEYFRPLVDIPKMGELVRTMLRQALESLVKRDLELVARVVEWDDQVDRMWYRLSEQVAQLMQQHPQLVPQLVALLLVARYLERIADHVVNIAERVAYMETGRLEALAHSHRADYEPEEDAPAESPGPPPGAG